ncbi:Hsp20/alpha crystallin family protein [bacterium]|nr:MAG: Hsp20/alpha crystallin family protein [bacterium]
MTMNTLNRRDPFAEIERAFDTLWNRSTVNPGNTLPIDLVEQDDALFVRAGLPGLRPEDVEINLDGNVLTIKGETKADWQKEDAKVYHREFRYGSFTRSLRLPKNLNLDAVDANVEHGNVVIRIPKLEESKPQSRKIEIKGLSQNAETPVENEA